MYKTILSYRRRVLFYCIILTAIIFVIFTFYLFIRHAYNIKAPFFPIQINIVINRGESQKDFELINNKIDLIYDKIKSIDENIDEMNDDNLSFSRGLSFITSYQIDNFKEIRKMIQKNQNSLDDIKKSLDSSGKSSHPEP